MPPADPGVAATASREIVVVWRTPPVLNGSVRSAEPVLRARIAKLGLIVRGSLAQRLSPSSRALNALTDAERGLPYDPARVWLVQAPDSGAARVALQTLANDPDVLVAEPEHVREPVALQSPFP